jgi:hypothetical protein
MNRWIAFLIVLVLVLGAYAASQLKERRPAAAQEPEVGDLKPLTVKLPPGDRIPLGEVVRLSPFSAQHWAIWPLLCRPHCCCCCCCSHSAAHAPAVANASSPAGPVTVDLDVTVEQILVLTTTAGINSEAHFRWQATGRPGLKVDIQVRSGIGWVNWTDIPTLRDKDPVDVGSWLVIGVPGDTFHFRAEAKDPQGNLFYSRIVTVR